VTDDARPLLVFFHSERSGPSRRMESSLAHLARKERTRLRVMRVDVDDQPDLAKRFRVEDVPTLVLVKQKRVVDRLVGRASAPTIETMLEPHLSAVNGDGNPNGDGGRSSGNPRRHCPGAGALP
jgi:thioredoxin-like negative regulator of GroEL